MIKAGIVAFAFGTPSNIWSNILIADIASGNAREQNIPIFTQRDVYIEQGVEVEYCEEKPENPLSTLYIARRAVRWAVQKDFEKLWIVAAKPHLQRCVRDLEYAAREAKAVLEIRVVEEINWYPYHQWYCQDSKQKRTRSEKMWRARERILEYMPMFLYKLLAS